MPFIKSPIEAPPSPCIAAIACFSRAVASASSPPHERSQRRERRVRSRRQTARRGSCEARAAQRRVRFGRARGGAAGEALPAGPWPDANSPGRSCAKAAGKAQTTNARRRNRMDVLFPREKHPQVRQERVLRVGPRPGDVLRVVGSRSRPDPHVSEGALSRSHSPSPARGLSRGGRQSSVVRSARRRCAVPARCGRALASMRRGMSRMGLPRRRRPSASSSSSFPTGWSSRSSSKQAKEYVAETLTPAHGRPRRALQSEADESGRVPRALSLGEQQEGGVSKYSKQPLGYWDFVGTDQFSSRSPSAVYQSSPSEIYGERGGVLLVSGSAGSATTH